MPATLSRALRERVEFVEADRVSEAQALAGADVAGLASEGISPAPGTLVQALAGGVVPVASRLPVYEELLGDGDSVHVQAGDARTLRQSPQRADRRVGSAPARPSRRGTRAPIQLVARGRRVRGGLRRLVARRHDTRIDARVRTRLAERRLIDVDLRMRRRTTRTTARRRSRCCWPRLKLRGLWGDRRHRPQRDPRARTRRNRRRDRGDRRRGGQDRRSGRGHQAVHREKIPEGDDAPGDDRGDQARQARVRAPIRSTASVPYRLSTCSTCSTTSTRSRSTNPGGDCRVQRRGGQFADQVPDPRRRRLGRARPPGRSARCGSPDARFDGPRSSSSPCRDADIVRKPASLLYVQALKFLQTKALPKAARRPRARAAARATRVTAQQVNGREGATPDALARTSSQAGQSDSDARHRRRDPREVPRASDPGAQLLRRELQSVPAARRAR